MISGRMKPFQASINDADGFKMRAACVCVKSKKEQEVGEDPVVVFFLILFHISISRFC